MGSAPSPAPGFHAPHRALIAFRGLQIVIRGSTAGPLGWLEEFFGPSPIEDSADPTICEISLAIDPVQHERLRASAGSDAGRAIDTFGLDGQFEQLVVWQEARDARLLYDAKAEAFLAIDAARRDVQLVAARDHARLRVSLMRVVRELATLHALHRGDLLVHGAAAVFGGRAIVIAGPKQSGKTTTLVGLLRTGRAQYLSNDRVVIAPAATPPLARGMATIMNVRADSLAHHPALRPPAADPAQRFYLTDGESAAGSPVLEPAKRALPPLSPVQFCRWLGVSPVAEAPVGTFVFPRVDPTVERFVVQRTTPADAAALIHASLFSSGPRGPVPEAFGALWDSPLPSHDDVLAGCRHLARACAVLECRLGPRAFHSPDIWRALTAADPD